MRVAVAIEGWADDAATPIAAAECVVAVREAWESASAHAQVWVTPVADGGPRSAKALAGTPVDVDGCDALQVGAALWLAPHGTRWDPVGLGVALRSLAARPDLRRKVVVPVGDEPPVGDATAVWGKAGLADARSALASLQLAVLTGSRAPLLGFHGMSAALRDGREGDSAVAAAAQEQESYWRQISHEADDIAAVRSLLGATRLSDTPGSGAAGGLAYCLAAAGGALLNASDAVAEAAGIAEAAADLMVSICPELTPRTLDYGSVAGIARLGAATGAPVIAISTALHVGKRDLMNAGLAGSHEGEAGLEGLRDAVTRVAHTWTRP
jgi:glycerate kinase